MTTRRVLLIAVFAVVAVLGWVLLLSMTYANLDPMLGGFGLLMGIWGTAAVPRLLWTARSAQTGRDLERSGSRAV